MRELVGRKNECTLPRKSDCLSIARAILTEDVAVLVSLSGVRCARTSLIAYVIFVMIVIRARGN